ncbi:PQQ-dependent dehydrogenase, methanol/ethanol family [Sphingobium sp. DEHP117]|uniref:PQQ-dependent dehydrogenase, methanol/ethanol family n=1 Tax=Sphingobium sp. DEHP117 TaxID=2993436 RepID=UPI0027D69FEF|nr:PQQ-dependent dehydrogenase, methanol/ethanol family [Sphingobium sp. DEHP117]MDQ4421580.1 PQQ-dependent dehydrogenase, methanol/ethanol family [Sphingobium sp. DEHP117]
MARLSGFAAVLAALATFTLAACGGQGGGSSSDGISAGDWPSYNRDADETRHSPLTRIDPSNVGELGLAWSFDFDNSHAQEATPLVIDGIMYVASAWNKLYALDAATGKQLWSFDPKVPRDTQLSACCDAVTRGIAYDKGRIFFATLDGRLIAVDAKNGRQLWSEVTVDQSKPYTITGAPRVAKGKVFIGNGGAEYGVRGYVSAYDQSSGKMVWRFYTVPGEPGKRDRAASDGILEKLARPTWHGNVYWKAGGGGTVWDSIVYDKELDQLIVGVGNGGPWDRFYRSENKGDNLFLGSVLALDPDTGAYKWHYQETPGDSWDFTSTQQISLSHMEIDGKQRPVALHAPKNGFFYVIDRRDGKVLSADKFANANWTERVDLDTGRPVENPDARYIDKPFLATVGSTGAHNWHPMSFDPERGLVFLPAQEVPQYYARDPNFAFTEGLWNLGIDPTYGGMPETKEQIAAAKSASKGSLVAWDPVKRKPRWTVEHTSAWNGGVLSTASGLVFQGLADGTFRAYASENGKELWRFDAQNTILAGAITYSVGDTQYVAVTVGGSAGTPAMGRLDGPVAHPPGRLLVFALGAKSTLPKTDRTLASIVVPDNSFSAAQIAKGEKSFGKYCAACHGFGTYSAGIFPDLKRSAYLGSRDGWKSVVIGGALADLGMVSFAKYFDEATAESIRAYVASEAKRQVDGNKASKAR